MQLQSPHFPSGPAADSESDVGPLLHGPIRCPTHTRNMLNTQCEQQ